MMPKKNTSIPVNDFGSDYHAGISVERMVLSAAPDFNGVAYPERHDRHSFHLLETGSITIEIDFEQHHINAPSLTYMHPDQVHRIISFENVTVSSWAINNENLQPEYRKLLDEITPAKPLALDSETFSVFSEAVALSIKFFGRKTDRLYHSLLKDSCNALVALVVSQYMEHAKPVDKSSRAEMVTRAFRDLLERNYATIKQPAAYAGQLHLSAAYLNECIKNTTGHPVSYHIQERVILEAKRLLYHSEKSVKEIATALGYDDYPYFSRLFTKVAGMTALAFRAKNHE